MEFTHEQIAKAQTAKSAEEIISIAKASGVELTEEEAKLYYAELNKEGELSDDELDAVAGGKGEEEGDAPQRCCPSDNTAMDLIGCIFGIPAYGCAYCGKAYLYDGREKTYTYTESFTHNEDGSWNTCS